MTSQLEIANNKLNRLKEEQDGIMKAIRKEKDLIPFGQPVIIGRRDIYKDLKRYYGKSIANSIEQDKQFSSPFIEERLYFIQAIEIDLKWQEFSSPFIEERLYLENFKNVFVVSFSALLSWSNIDQNNGLD